MSKRQQEVAASCPTLPDDVWHLIVAHCGDHERRLVISKAWLEGARSQIFARLASSERLVWAARDPSDDPLADFEQRLANLPYIECPDAIVDAARTLYGALSVRPVALPRALHLAHWQLSEMSMANHIGAEMADEHWQLKHMFLVLRRGDDCYWVTDVHTYKPALQHMRAKKLSAATRVDKVVLQDSPCGELSLYPRPLHHLRLPAAGTVHCMTKKMTMCSNGVWEPDCVALLQAMQSSWYAFGLSCSSMGDVVRYLRGRYAMQQHQCTLARDMASVLRELSVQK